MKEKSLIDNFKKQSKQKKTFVFLTVDAHGHVNSMMGLADQLKDFGHRTIFICADSSIPKLRGHELFLMKDKIDKQDNNNDNDNNQKQQVDNKINGEGSIFLEKNLNDKWANLIDTINTNDFDEESLIVSLKDNFKTMVTFTEDEILRYDNKLEKIILKIKPDLVILDLVSPFPCIHRLSNDLEYCKSVGLNKTLLWMGFMSCNPMPLYHSYGFRENKNFPPGLLGLSASMNDLKEINRKHMQFVELKREAKLPELRFKLAKLSHLKDINNLNEIKNDINFLLFSKFASNISPWFNVYIFPRLLDYAGEHNVYLPKDNWLQVDSIIRQPLKNNCNQMDELILEKVSKWKQLTNLNDENNKKIIIYIAMGTTMSLRLNLMTNLLKQLFACLDKELNWNFIMALGVRSDELSDDLKFEISKWESKNRLITSKWFPQPELMRRKLIDVCVTHGGNNTICEIFQFKIPHLVVISGLYDQLDNARRVSDLKLGVSLKSSQFVEHFENNNHGRVKEENLLHNSIRESLKLNALSRNDLGREENHIVHDYKIVGVGVGEEQEKERDAKYCAQVIEAKLLAEI